ncbi:hypothetical protein TSAR_001763 [Trichomalopsis sarcophagae]|uniref:Replication protein A OB domain-containing protein n=1 Tax=Trichomalopsis sarcophagae TaxID=543379 RepID=A0A232EK15_9HYME|nr:hypothetical protein TSAR_001763 [Trichomalopsis sarcophagae]
MEPYLQWIALTDIVDIIRNIGEVENIKDDTFVKREVTLKDDLKNELTIVLWNKNAKSFNGNVNDVMSIKAGKVVEYKGIKKVSLTIVLWNKNAKSFNGNVNDVMSIKAGKVVEYKGIKKVSVLSITILKFNDKSIPEVKR